jgi:tetratricopeptide (TPR) repeat protein
MRSHYIHPNNLFRLLVSVQVVLAVCWSGATCFAADFDDAKRLFRSGRYDECIEICKTEVERGVWNESWSRLLIETYLTTGQYFDARSIYEEAIERYSLSLRLRLLGIETYRMNDDPIEASKQQAVIPELLDRMPARYTGRDELVPLGKYFLMTGEDARKVLEICFDEAIKEDPEMVEAYVASAELAIEKRDDKVATQTLDKAAKLDPNDPQIAFLQAKAWMASDSEKSSEYLERAFELNDRHVPSLLFKADLEIDSEDYDEANKTLDIALSVNPNNPIAWALRANIAHLQGRYEDEGKARHRALEPWSLNPEVDFTIGRKLSQHYRFAESIQYQMRALKMDADYLPAKTQLAQDMLRTGNVENGWRLIEEVRARDPYDVATFNLRRLEEELKKFQTIEIPGFVIRMDPTEATIYGDSVVELLTQARSALTEKYAVELQEPVYVEIFPKQKDFAIRTFGMPGGQGFLGVCFGQLITANSPASQGTTPSNLHSVLWHEYCHVVTLQKTKNKMPRWLSEGISVYEERQRDPTWGQSLDTTYRQMILSEDLTPVSKLSSAFLNAKTPMHLQFAYFESSMVIEYLLEKHGLDVLKRILDDLAVGMPINESLKRYTNSLEALDAEFAEYARRKAESFAPNIDYSEDGLPERPTIEQLEAWLTDHPNHYQALEQTAAHWISEKAWDKATGILERMQKLNPDDGGESGLYGMLAAVNRAQNKLDTERTFLIELASRNSDCLDALERLIQLDRDRNDWTSVARWTDRVLQVNPLLPSVQTIAAEAAEKTGDAKRAQRALQAQLALQPVDPSAVHYNLAKAYLSLEQIDKARRHVLMALEESPRYREALQLLLEIQERANTQSNPPVENSAETPP